MLLGLKAEPRIPVTLITGFLGAGKTTLLNHFLRGEHGLKMAVLVNDFGSINIDRQLVASVDENVLSLANGCICCTIQDDLVAQLGTLLMRPEAVVEHIVIEASGVSDPAGILRALAYPVLRNQLVLDGVVAVVDVESFPKLEGEMAHLAYSQLEVADLVVLNKCDLVPPEQIKALRNDWLYPKARVLEVEFGAVPLPVLLGGWALRPHSPTDDSGGDAKTDLAASHHHGHDQLFDTWSWESTQALDAQALRTWLQGLPADVMRAKGWVYAHGWPQRLLCQMVGPRVELSIAGPWGAAPPGTQLVFIARKGCLNRVELANGLAACGAGD